MDLTCINIVHAVASGHFATTKALPNVLNCVSEGLAAASIGE